MGPSEPGDPEQPGQLTLDVDALFSRTRVRVQVHLHADLADGAFLCRACRGRGR